MTLATIKSQSFEMPASCQLFTSYLGQNETVAAVTTKPKAEVAVRLDGSVLVRDRMALEITESRNS